jgi:hypothetical protein
VCNSDETIRQPGGICANGNGDSDGQNSAARNDSDEQRYADPVRQGAVMSRRNKLDLALAVAAVISAIGICIFTARCSSGGGGGHHNPPARSDVKTIRLHLTPALGPSRAVLQKNFDACLPIINAAPGAKRSLLDVTIRDGLVGTQCPRKSWRNPQSGAIDMFLWTDAPGVCEHSGEMSRVHWIGGGSWEIAHLLGCDSGLDTCGDGNYQTSEYAAMDRGLFNKSWLD